MGVRNLIRQFCVDLYQKIDTYILRGPVGTKKVPTKKLIRSSASKDSGPTGPECAQSTWYSIVTQTVINSVNPVLYDPLYN